MKEPIWVTREECLALHEMLLAQYGGLAGVRDEGLLESALSKPNNLFVYASPTMVAMAASYATEIVLNHPFLDGNKRTGFMTAAVFLGSNGYRMTAPEESVVTATVGLASGKLKEADYAAWLGVNSKRS